MGGRMYFVGGGPLDLTSRMFESAPPADWYAVDSLILATVKEDEIDRYPSYPIHVYRLVAATPKGHAVYEHQGVKR